MLHIGPLRQIQLSKLSTSLCIVFLHLQILKLSLDVPQITRPKSAKAHAKSLKTTYFFETTVESNSCAMTICMSILFLHCFESLSPSGKKNSLCSGGSLHPVTKAAGSMLWQPGLEGCLEKMSVRPSSSAAHSVRDRMSWAGLGSRPSGASVWMEIG